ncbi:MAG: quinone oxidoreductase [Desulfuromonadales bacterium GWD2_61_12]|nr:MAG: quinone oxidoreductase [Desulfuromonadales bacterium GWC2_61_20]OGR36801.1 MAG: quinone oxidoreductase [Desulfuromonadales bacterium GWD2_61_12]HAD03358.1 oxidoreductase [Desulfuromonas sp.]HBT83826.1 oxidoreductase [Desulfuromonas sp.]
MEIPPRFQALVTEETRPGLFTRRIVARKVAELPAGDVLIRVAYSSLNYKDALSASGRPGVTKRYPHTPGIDAAGEVVSCSDGTFAVGDKVLVTGFDLGMNTPGGFGQYIRVPSRWVLPLPAGLSLQESMILGTAGLTAGLSLARLQQAGVIPASGEILVTGASGGVGSLAVQILARAGYAVTAATGKAGEHAWLQGLGASNVIARVDLLEGAERPLLKERWGGVVDCVGGATLAAALKATRYGGVVTCCGLVGSSELNVNVFPFILRGVSLLGIDSVEAPMAQRRAVWEKLAGPWKPARLQAGAEECDLAGLETRIAVILAGGARGRTVVRLGEE